MSVVIVTGSAGLIGSEAVRHFASLGLDVVGIDNDMRKQFFGAEASTAWNVVGLASDLGDAYSGAGGSEATATRVRPRSRIFASRPWRAVWSRTAPARRVPPSGAGVMVRPSNQADQVSSSCSLMVIS